MFLDGLGNVYVSRRRIRTLKPEFFEDERVYSISRDARLVSIGLITLADDRGRLRYKPMAIVGDLFPEEAVTIKQFRGWMTEICEIGLAKLYETGVHAYLWLPQFLRHQVINRPTESELPSHPEDPWANTPLVEALKLAKSRSAPGDLTEDSVSSPGAISGSSGHTRGSLPFPSVPHISTSNVARETIDEALTILGARWNELDEVAVENCVSMYPSVDLLQGCRLAVTWASDASWQVQSLGATLRAAMRKLDSEKPKVDERTSRRRRRGAAMESALVEPAA